MRRALIFVLLLAVAIRAEEPALSEAALKQLERDKVGFGTETYKQVFSAYIGSDLPVFVTSDSILNGYHVLFEESVLRLERARAQQLGPALRILWDGLPKAEFELQKELVTQALRRARLTLLTAMVILDAPPKDPAQDLLKIATEEAERIRKAEGLSKPEWLGPPDPGFGAIDYALFKPTGFYGRSEELQRYFRAVRWLQQIPFRVEHDVELVAAIALIGAFDNNEAPGVISGYPSLLGHGVDRAIAAGVSMWSTPLDSTDLGQIRDSIEEPSFRILPEAALPDSWLLKSLSDARGGKLPTGLDLCTALGSSWARKRWSRVEERGKETGILEEGAERLSARGSLFGEYLYCLKALLDEPEADAPAFMAGEPWRIKSCNTALAGWAQLRHTWVLQAKPVAFYLGIAETEPGFVEPDPEFFARLRRLIENSEKLLRTSGAFGLEFLRRDLASKLDDPQIAQYVVYASGVDPDEIDESAVQALLEQTRAKLLDFKQPLDKRLEQVVRGLGGELEPRWRALQQVVSRLEAMAHKQLRGVAWNEGERSFLEHYGEILANVMFYGGNSYLNPRDDAPRIVEIGADARLGIRWSVGVGRARELYVLYPTPKGERLCRGAVMDYYEVTESEPMTDAEWKARLDADDAPQSPDWTKPLRLPAGE